MQIAVIPNVVQNNKSQPLNLGSRSSNTQLINIQKLNTNFPYFKKMNTFISSGDKRISDKVPFINRSFYFYFDVISGTDDNAKLTEEFNLFIVNLKNPEINKAIAYFVIYLILDLQKVIVNSVETYIGTIKIKPKIYENLNKTMMYLDSATINVHYEQQAGRTFINKDSILRFSKTKYREADYFALLQPQFLLFNVFLSILVLQFDILSISIIIYR